MANVSDKRVCLLLPTCRDDDVSLTEAVCVCVAADWRVVLYSLAAALVHAGGGPEGANTQECLSRRGEAHQGEAQADWQACMATLN
jgi:hypothetical protein